MRGLTNEERLVLTCPYGTKPTTLRHALPLVQRGLIKYTRRGAFADYDVTPLAALALRLDDAARAMGGGRG